MFKDIFAIKIVTCSLACLLPAFLQGCGKREPPYVPVSGMILLNDKPLGDAKLIFEPVAEGGDVAPGMPSYGRTDQSGEFTLSCPELHREGAVVGKHRVRIITSGIRSFTQAELDAARKVLQKQEAGAGNAGTPISDERVISYLSDKTQMTTRETLPARYHQNTELTFIVPLSGAKDANFHLTSP